MDAEKGAGIEWGGTVDCSCAPCCALFLAVLAASAACEVRILNLEQ